MKNIKKIVAILCVQLLFSVNVFAQEISQKIYIDDTFTGYTYENIDGYRYLPLRQISEELGYNVMWDEINRCIYIVKGINCKNEIGKSDFVCIHADTMTGISWSNELRGFGRDKPAPLLMKISNGITYIAPLDYCGLLDLKSRPFTETEEVRIETRKK